MNIARRMQETRLAFARWQQLSTDLMRELETMTGTYTCPLPMVEKIQRMTATHYALDVSVMVSPARPNKIAQARQVAMLLCRRFTDHSLEEIGLCFGNRDHGTVRHACTRIEQMASVDASLRGDVRDLSSRVAALTNRQPKAA